MADTNITSCSRLPTNIGQGGQQHMKNVKLYSQAPEDLSGLYLVFWWANFTTTTATSTHPLCMNTAKLIQKCVSWYSSASYPDVQLWTLILLTLEDFWSSIRWAAAPCGQWLPGLKEIPESKIYTEKKKEKGKVGRLKAPKCDSTISVISYLQENRNTDIKCLTKVCVYLQPLKASMGSEGLHNVLCDQHFCTLRKWVFAWGNPLWRGTWGHQSHPLIGRCKAEQKLDLGL